MVPPSCTLSNFLLVSPVVEENRKNCNHCILIKMQISIIHVKFTNFHQCDDLTKLKLFKVNIFVVVPKKLRTFEFSSYNFFLSIFGLHLL
jgi:hypothetical protein